ncbi:hypothetical protein GGI21_002583 [Coemansia aciculifera]|nr:hypothetical protein GGI21_002583 [Coemansia aciculifera]
MDSASSPPPPSSLPIEERDDDDGGKHTTPLLSSSPRGATEYRLKDIQWRDMQTGRLRDVKIVTQSENGPCPLLALINVLTLSTPGFSPLNSSLSTTTDSELIELLANHLLTLSSSGGDESDIVGSVLSVLPTLSKGLDVDLQFSHIYDFAATEASRLFRAFGVDLVHGWVVDPEEDRAVAGILLDHCRNSYEGAVEFIFAADELSGGQVVGRDGDKVEELPGGDRSVADAVLLNEWMLANATQLTDCGLFRLGTMLPDNHLCVLFRNNHFSTLFRRSPGELYLLCTDDVVAGDDRIVWETLSDVRQTTARFLDSQFQPLTNNQTQTQTQKQREIMTTDSDYATPIPSSSSNNRVPPEHRQASEQIDEDYALALRLHDEEQQQRQDSGQRQRLQVRQQDRLPPGMDVKEHGHLYGVPVVTREGENRLARAIYRSASDENFSRRMTDAFLPHEAAANKARQQQDDQQRRRHQQPPPQSPKEKDLFDKCIIC